MLHRLDDLLTKPLHLMQVQALPVQHRAQNEAHPFVPLLKAELLDCLQIQD